MAVEDFGGSVLGKPIEVLTADHNEAFAQIRVVQSFVGEPYELSYDVLVNTDSPESLQAHVEALDRLYRRLAATRPVD